MSYNITVPPSGHVVEPSILLYVSGSLMFTIVFLLKWTCLFLLEAFFFSNWEISSRIAYLPFLAHD